MKLGDFVKRVLSPFVKGTKFEGCDECEERRKKLNKFSDWVVLWANKLTCSCWYKKQLSRFRS